MAKEKFKTELDKLIRNRGVSRIWIWKHFHKISRTHFWRKINNDTITDGEKDVIRKLLK